jgi:hypothetical protein
MAENYINSVIEAFLRLNKTILTNHTGLAYNSSVQVVPSGMKREVGDIGKG